MPPNVFSWTGFYVGPNAGFTWSSSNVDTIATDVFGNPMPGNGVAFGIGSAALVNGSRSVKNNSFIGGGQLGHNWLFDNIVVGVETDFQGIAGGNKSRTLLTSLVVVEPINQALTVSKRTEWLGTVRGRIGVLMTPTVLPYLTGGLAYGGVKSNLAISQQVIGAAALPNVYTSAGGVSKTRVGWALGAGGEWMFMNNWSAKFEYMYYDLGKVIFANGALANFNIGGRCSRRTFRSRPRASMATSSALV